MEAFEKGMQLDPENRECKEGYQKTLTMISSQSHASSGND